MRKLYEDSKILVETNGSGEIFVQPKGDQRATLRIFPERMGRRLVLTAHDGTMTPCHNPCGLPAMEVAGGRPS